MFIYLDCVLCKVFYFRNVSIMHPVFAQLRIHYLIYLCSPSLSLSTLSLYLSLSPPSLFLSLSSRPLCFCLSLSPPSIYFSLFPFLSLFLSLSLSFFFALYFYHNLPLSVFFPIPSSSFLSLSYFPLSFFSLYFLRHFIPLSSSIFPFMSLSLSLLLSLSFSYSFSVYPFQLFHKLH